MLTAGDKLFSGAIVTAQGAAAYNRASARIAAFERAGKPAPEHLLNGRHKILAMMAAV